MRTSKDKGVMAEFSEEITKALCQDRTIDMVMKGAKSGKRRKTEIWFNRVGDRIIICGTPSAGGDKGPYAPRHWLANLKANPEFLFCLKESIEAELPARAVIITDLEDRRVLMTAPETQWYRDQVGSVELLVKFSPIVEVFFGNQEETAKD
jgi:hypothetical protein